MPPPSVFCCFPWDSVFKKSEHEQIAQNIMKIRRARGDKWELGWEEYKDERVKNGTGFSEREKYFFDEVMPKIQCVEDACKFSPKWLEAYLSHIKA